ncbi:MAG: AAA family ATPase [Cytophagales bacterium]|nr:AAA family ATPase [Cytophagales bacterium]
MIKRNLLTELIKWKESSASLPLILRGARQVGKTTLINEFGKSFDQYLYFNLEKDEDAILFKDTSNAGRLVQVLFISRGFQLNAKYSTLIFIDEVQEKPEIIEALRYFKEDFSYLHVIVTGSLLEFGLSKLSKIPVGRVEFMELHPLNFKEYLLGSKQESLIQLLTKPPIENDMLPIIFNHFHDFTLIGGMPGITAAYIKDKDLTRLRSLYSGIIESYKDDVEKYAASETIRKVVRHIMDTAPFEIDNRISLNHFGASNYRTREVKEAMSSLSKARLLELIYPSTQTVPPIVSDLKKRPRLHFLDVGLVNYQLGLHQELLTIQDLHQISKGKLVQQIVNQEIKSLDYLPGGKRAFWIREERGTSSEVDIIYPFKNMLIPIEVKSGASGTLRSLHEFMDRCPHNYAVRVYSGKLSIDELSTSKGKKYQLLNLPYFLSAWIPEYLEWFSN